MAEDPNRLVAEPLPEHDAMVERAAPGRALLGGTKGMREAGETYLPRRVREDKEAYAVRLAGSCLEPIYEEAIRDIADAPFEKEISRSEDVPEVLVERMTDIDRLGNDLSVVARQLYWSGLIDGVSFALVDMPTLPARANAAEDDAMGAVPYWTIYPMQSVFRWYLSPKPGGGQRLDQVHLREPIRKRVSEWGFEDVKRVRVLYASGVPAVTDGAGEEGTEQARAASSEGLRFVRWQLWEQQKTETGPRRWMVVNSGTMKPLTEISLAAFSPHRQVMGGRPPLEAVAWINIAHWQSASVQRHALDFARFPILFGRLLRRKPGQKVTVGPDRLIEGVDPQSDLKHVEHTGAAIEAGERDLRHLESRGAALGHQALTANFGSETATGRAIDEARSSRSARAWAAGLEDALNIALSFSGQFLGLDDVGRLSVYKDFGLSQLSQLHLDALAKARERGDIGPEDYLEQLKSRGVLLGDVRIEELLERSRGQDYLDLVQAARDGGDLSRETYLQLLMEANVFPADWQIQEELARVEREAPRMASGIIGSDEAEDDEGEADDGEEEEQQ